ncbi:spermatid-specific manchette-related protein 1 [Suncus etruscus]|uniref:spermatid-specific manchette-related protein 1 n=1 Tax=Suncus etruscus TaxID=109475 RepID=UPI00210FE7BC|nr:spermatid-specific manchette-related protein 1 [Suncus etruscus]
MFLFSHKTKTPISTYTDSYRVPTSIKEVYKDPSLRVWEVNKFVTRGLTQRMQHPENLDDLQRMVNCTMQDYTYKDTFTGHPYFPEKYWISPLEVNRCPPNYQWGDQYNSWRMEPYYYVSWNNRYPTFLPPLPKQPAQTLRALGDAAEGAGQAGYGGPARAPQKEQVFVARDRVSMLCPFQAPGMETVGRAKPVECLPTPLRLSAYDQEVRMNPLTSLSRYQPLPQITPRCGCMSPLPGRLPLQGYESPCSGRHYCLRGMDYIITGAPCGESTLQLPRVQQPTVRSTLPYDHRPGMQCSVITPPPSFFPYPSLQWKTSHFKKTGGAQKDNYVVHPEFASEIYAESC